MKLDTVFLDAGGVLVWPNWTRVASALGAHGVAIEPGALAKADPYARRAIDRGELIAASTDQRRGWTYFDLVLSNAGVPTSDNTAAALAELEEYHRVHNLWELVPPFVRPALTELRATGRRLVVVSNANGTLQRAFARLGLAPFFDHILDSADEGIEKPDRRYFDLALARAGASAETTIHVGDLYHVDVTGARAAGLAAVLVDEAGLRPEADCPRIQSIAELPGLLDRL